VTALLKHMDWARVDANLAAARRGDAEEAVKA
jgi:hypothetical protein